MLVYVCIYTYIHMYTHIICLKLLVSRRCSSRVANHETNSGDPSSWDDCPTVETSGSDPCVSRWFRPETKDKMKQIMVILDTTSNTCNN